MIELSRESLRDPGPPAQSLTEARALAQGCRRCPLWRIGTQTVFGEGPASATVMLVGEQPGDQEDLAGKPFVGPAGKILDRALEEAGIARRETYVTNAVKHFKHVPRGKRRLHQKPDAGEIDRCRWWLELELGFVQPQVVVALGASAAKALFRRTVTIGRERGKWLPFAEKIVGFVTIHPSFVLRQRDAASRETTYQSLVEDLRQIARRIHQKAA
jgi:uracil-DNA glycosylase